MTDDIIDFPKVYQQTSVQQFILQDLPRGITESITPITNNPELGAYCSCAIGAALQAIAAIVCNDLAESEAFFVKMAEDAYRSHVEMSDLDNE